MVGSSNEKFQYIKENNYQNEKKSHRVGEKSLQAIR
jgi:hypothetical protein